MKGSKSFSTRLSLNILAITSVIFIVTIGIAAFSSHRMIAEEAIKSAENLRDASILRIEKTLNEVAMTVEASSWLVMENIDDEEYLYHITRKMVEENPNIIGSAIAFDKNYFRDKYYFSPYSYIDAQTGEVRSKQLGNKQYDYFYMDWFQIPYLLGEPCWGEPYYDDGGADYKIATYSYPLKDVEGRVFAIVTADISLKWISELLSSIRPYPNSNVMLISRNGSFITNGENQDISGETIFSTLYYTSDRDRNIGEMAAAISRGERGTMQYSKGAKISFAVYAPLENGWKACISCDYNDVLSRASKMNLILILVGLFGLIVLFLLSYLTIHKLTKPLTEFSDSVLEIAKGNFDVNLPELKNDDEVKRLRDSFEYMQKSLKDYMNELRATTSAKEKYESELNIANKIQMAMLPTNFPVNDKVGLHAMVHPAKEVGGDLYDFFIKDGSLYFAVGDVSGKGIPASLFMAITRASFNFIAKMGLPMNEVVSKMNNAMAEGNTTGMFITLFVGKIDLETGEFEYCNAGHNPIVVISPEGKAGYLKAKPNLAAGLVEDFPYVLEKEHLDSGARLVIYTDGVTEAERADKSQFGEDRLLKWATTSCSRLTGGASEACQDLFADVKDFVEGNEQNDDITIMTIKLK